MESILKSDIFFFITSVAVIVLALISTIILYYFIKLMKHIEYIAHKVRTETDLITRDIDDVRNKFKDGSMKMGGLAGMASGFAAKSFGSVLTSFFDKKGGSSKKRSSSKSKKTDEDGEDEE